MTDAPRPLLHEFAESGNCYKVRLTAAHCGIAINRREWNILAGETRTPEFLERISAEGRIPVLQLGDRFIPESNAACLYLADGSALLPDDRFDRADTLRWLFWEQYSHEPNVATLRYWRRHVPDARLTDAQRAQLGPKRAAGEAALALMDRHLAAADFLAAGRFTVADIALYAYTHVAEEGGFDLAAYPALGRWLRRVAAQPGHVPLDD